MDPTPSITRLPKDLRDQIARLRGGGRSLDEIMEKLGELDMTDPRPAPHAEPATLAPIIERMTMARTIAGVVGDEHPPASASELHRANIELMHANINHNLTALADGRTVVLDPKSSLMLATAMEKTARAAAIDQKRALDMALAIKAAATRHVEKVAKAEGLSRSTVAAIKQAILGVSLAEAKAAGHGA
jgi:hypothetical protein